MTDDLTTLLRDAGREPTVDVDVDAIHGRGRRRAVGRRVAIGAGALAVLGVLGVGVVNLLDAPEAPIVDQAPGDGTPVDEDAAPAVTAATVTPFEVATAGVDVGLLEWVGGDSFAGQRHRVDGTSTDFGIAGVGPVLADPVVSRDGTVWVTRANGDLLRSTGGGGFEVPYAAEGDLALLPLAAGPTPDSILARQVVLRGDARANPAALFVVDASGAVRQREGFDFDTVVGDGTIVAAAADGDALALLVQEDGGVRAELLLPGVDGSTEVLADAPVDERPRLVGGAVGIVGDAVLAVEQTTDGPWRLHLTSGPGGGAMTIPGTGDGIGVTGMSVLPEAGLALLDRRTDDFDNPALEPVVVDLVALAAGDGDAMSLLDRPGLGSLIEVADPTARSTDCSLDGSNAPPTEGDHVWFACFAGVGTLDPFPFMRVAIDDIPRGDLDSVFAEAVQAFLDGPPEESVAIGVSPLAPVGEVELAAIRTDELPRVTVEVRSAGDLGIPTGASDGWAFRVALAAALLQFDEVDEVVVVTDGRCGDWEGAASGDPDVCIVWTDDDMPWNQPGLVPDVVEVDLEDGRHAVYLHGIDTDARTLTFDVVQWLTGEEARAAWEEESGEPDGPPNDYLIRNENGLLRTLWVAADVDVQLVRLQGTGSADLKPGTWAELPDYLADGLAGDGGSLWYAPFWLTVDGGVITAIEEQYVP